MKNKNIITYFIFILLATTLFSQPAVETWYFGVGSGISFKSGEPEMVSGPLRTNEGCAVISDNIGDPLLYTDGQNVWNGNNEIIKNGQDLKGHPSTSQSAVIIPMPNNNDLYYIVTALNVGRENGLNYSLVDISKNDGKGEVIEKNIPLHNRITEKITVCAGADYKTFWLIAHEWNSKNYLSFKIDENGISTEPIISQGDLEFTGQIINTYGYIKASPDSRYLINAHQEDHKLELCSFDNETGQIEVLDVIELGEGVLTYGLEFSPDSRIIYLTTIFPESKIYQLLHPELTNVDNTKFYEIDGWSTEYKLGAAQLGPDNKLYITNAQDSSIGIIHNPMKVGKDANYERNALSTVKGTYTDLGLPNFITNYFQKIFLCDDYLYNEKNVGNSNVNFVQDQPPPAIDITEPVKSVNGAVWSKVPVDIKDGFVSEFKMTLSEGGNVSEGVTGKGGNGFAFVIQSEGNDVLGTDKNGIGYEGLKNSFVIEFDQVKDGTDKSDNHIDVLASKDHVQKSEENQIAETENIPLFLSNNNSYYIMVDYRENKLEIYLSPENYFLEPQIVINDFDIEDYIDLKNGSAYIGVVAGTGFEYQRTSLNYFRYCPAESIPTQIEDEFISNITDYDLQISPNPAIDLIRVNYESSSLLNSYRIYDLKGNLKIENSLTENTRLQNEDIDVSSLTNGVYIIKLELANEVKTGKFLIHK